MQFFSDLLFLAKGYRTYAAASAAAVAFLSPFTGAIDNQTATALAGACLSAAQIFHRMATADIAANVSQSPPPPPTVQPG